MELGPLRIEARRRDDALWAVDGQQRLTSLACVLLHPNPTASSIFALWFDLKEQRFVRPRHGDDILPHWLPMNRVLDAVELGQWWNESQELTGRTELYRVALQLGRRIRESKLPVYIVETSDEDALKIIFTRLNTSGVAMRETEVFNALHTAEGQRCPQDVLADVSREARMGTLDEAWRLRCLRAVAGELLDTPVRQELEAYREQVSPTVMALGAALDFLRDLLYVPHLRLMPYRLPIVALTRFFHLHKDPAPRTRILLRRWLWRGIVNRHHRDTDNAQLRWLSGAIDDDEQASVERLIRDVGAVSEREIVAFADQVARAGRTFNAAESKVYGSLLAHAGPRHVQTGDLLDIGQLLDDLGPSALQKVASGREDRILHPYLDDPAAALDGAALEVRRSHHWENSAEGEEGRRARLAAVFRDLLMAWCEPGMPDFASLTATLAALGEE